MPLSAGQRIGRFRIQSILGSGGMGTVYRARDERLQRDVAIKVLHHESVAEQAVISRFKREANALAGLSHPNIVALHDFIEEDGQFFAVMEYLEGETLDTRLTGEPLTEQEYCEIASSISRGLIAAHRNGVIHRDIKPSNIFLTPEGTVKLLDFGLATTRMSSFDGETQTACAEEFHTQVGTVMGTVGYMSPEQVRGKPTDQRSDIFSLGAVLYEMVAGQKAFVGDTAVETMTAILKAPVPDPARSDLPRGHRMYEIISRCLAKEPDTRFATAETLLAAIEKLEPIESSPSFSRTVLLGSMAVVAVALVAAGVVFNRGGDVLRQDRVSGKTKIKLARVPHDATSTREDFDELCAAFIGRWTGEVASVIGESDVTMSREEPESYFLEFSLSADGKSMTTTAVGSKSSGIVLHYYDAAAKQIRVTDTSSEGVVNQHTIHREGKEWIRYTEQSAADGTVREFHSVFTFAEDGNTITTVIRHTNADGSINEQTNVWRRLSK